MEVHRVLGRGFLEAVYQEAMCLELSERSIPYVRPDGIRSIITSITSLRNTILADFVAFEKIIVEIKAINQLIFTRGITTAELLKSYRFRSRCIDQLRS